MPIRINELSVIDSFNEVIPKAASRDEEYKRAVASGITEYEPPVTLDIDDVHVARSLGAHMKDCLIAEPTERRLRHYKTVHYGVAVGASLKVGWYLIGGEYADGRQIGLLNVGAINAIDADEVRSIVQVIHQYAVMPAIQNLANSSHQTPGDEKTSGFFGV